MLSSEMNDRLSRVGPGTPGGDLMRRYWIPFLPAAKLDEDPVQKVRLLGEDLTLYRDKQGRLGLIGERCLHRAVDMQWGIPDEDGLRCPYHGWKYDQTGQCIDTPLEAADSTFKQRIKLAGYPVEELGGLIFAYMGPQPAPLLPRWDLYVWPNTIRQIGITMLHCNWLQCQENTGDPVHGVYLHGHLYKYALEKLGAFDRLAQESEVGYNNFIKLGKGIKGLYATATKYGMEKGVIYSKALGAPRDYVSRHSTVIFPFYTHTGGAAGAPRSEFQIRVPIDDEHTYHIQYTGYAGPPGIAVPTQDTIPYYEVPIWDEHGKPILDTITHGDMVAWWSQGPLTDRSKEKLGRTDVPVLFLRRQLEQQIRIVEQGGDPMNVFRDPAEAEIVYGAGSPPAEWVDADWATQQVASGRMNANSVSLYHMKGAQKNTDWLGPALPLVMDLHRKIDEAQQKASAVPAIRAGALTK